MDIRKLIQAESSFTIAALLQLFGEGRTYKCQESALLTTLATQYEKNSCLSDPQLKACGRILQKYHKEFQGLVPIDLEPVVDDELVPIDEMKTAWIDGDKIRFKTPDKADVIKTKRLFNRRYGSKSKVYSCAFTIDNIAFLKEWGFKLDRDLRRDLRRLRSKANTINELIHIPGLVGTLRDYQNKAVAFIDMKGGRALIGDDMGLGKTIQALAYVKKYEHERPILIVTTGGSKLNWQQECNIWLPGESTYICSGRNPDIDKVDADIAIINYEILTTKKGKKWFQTLINSEFKMLIGDEIHYIKNPKAKRTPAFIAISETIKKFIAMSGTPMDNRPIELFVFVNLLAPWLFPSYWDYAKRYCAAYEGNFGWDVTGKSNIPELFEKLSYIMIRRKKSEVLTELPDKVRSVIPIEYDKAVYKRGLKAFEAWGARDWKEDDEGCMQRYKENPAAAMVQIEKLKFAAAKAKLKSVLLWISDYLESEAKLVVFAAHIEIQEAILKHFGKIAVSSKQKDKAVYAFQKCKNCDIKQDKHKANPDACNNYEPNLDTRLFVGGRDAREAITLTAANATCFVELWWNGHDQAEDRVYRIGQERDSVYAYYLIADDTIDNDIMKLLDGKTKTKDGALDGIDTKKSDMLTGLLKGLL